MVQPSMRSAPCSRPEFVTVRGSAGLRVAPRLLHLDHRGYHAGLEDLLGRGRRKQMHHAGDNAGPASLMAGAEAGPVVAVEVFVEQDQVTPVRVFLELLRAAVDRPPAILVL